MEPSFKKLDMFAHLVYYHKVPKEKLDGLTDHELNRIHDVIHRWTSPQSDLEKSLSPKRRMLRRKLP